MSNDEKSHCLTIESEMAFDMDQSAPLACICGETGDAEEMLDHLIETTMDF